MQKKTQISCHYKHLTLAIGFLASNLLIQVVYAENAKNSQTNFLPSLLEFRPKKEIYPVILSEIVGKLKKTEATEEQATRLKAYRGLLVDLAEIRKTASRGHLDEIYQLEGYIYEQLSETQNAVLAYENSLNHQASNLVSLFRHALLIKNKASCINSIREFNEVRWRSKKYDHEVYFQISECYLNGQAEKSLEYLKKSLVSKPNYLPAIRSILQLHKKGDIELENQNLLQYLKLLILNDPSDFSSRSMYANKISQIYDPLNDIDKFNEAQRYINEAVVGSHYENDEAVLALFNLLVKKRDIVEAKTLIETALKSRNGSSKGLSPAIKQLELEALI